MRASLVALVLLSASLVPAFAQSSPSATPSLGVTTRLGDLLTPHVVNVDAAAPNSMQTIVVFDPVGNQTKLVAQTSSSGHVSWSLAPPSAGWQLGLYRVVLALADGRSVSSTFVAGDGQPHLFAEPNLPSPTSAFNFVGIGLKPNSTAALTLLMAGAQGQREITAGVDEAGSFSVFVWPQELGVPFFSAGNYLLEENSLGLTSNFQVREHPVSAAIAVHEPVVAGHAAAVSLVNYPAGRFVWAVYAGVNGTVAGELLLGPVDVRGKIEASVPFATALGGDVFLASPYDWGETSFYVLSPSPTATVVPPTSSSTPTVLPSTIPTATDTPRATATPKATATPRATPTRKATAHQKVAATPRATSAPKRKVTQKKQSCSKPRHGKKPQRSCARHRS